MNALFVIGSPVPLRYVIDNKVMAFRKGVNTERISPGIRMGIYTTTTAYGNPSKDRAQVLATGRVASKVMQQSREIDGEVFPTFCRLDFDFVLPWRSGLPFPPLVSRLDFVGTARRYPSVFRRSIVWVPDADFEKILREFGRAIEQNQR